MLIIILFNSITFIIFCIFFVEKGVKVVRSPSEILELIKSYDSTTLKSTPEVVQLADHSNKNCVTSSLKCSQDVPKTLPHIGPKRILKSNILGQVSDSKVHQEIKEDAALLSNNLNKKLVLFTLSLILWNVLITIFILDLMLHGVNRLIRSTKHGKMMDT